MTKFLDSNGGYPDGIRRLVPTGTLPITWPTQAARPCFALGAALALRSRGGKRHA